MTVTVDPGELSQIRKDVSGIAQGFAALEANIKSIVGPPSLEERLRNYIDGRDEHGKRNAQDALVNLQKILEQDSQIRQLQTENRILQQSAEIAKLQATTEQTERLRLENHIANQAETAKLSRRLGKVERNVLIGQAGLTAILGYIAWVVQHPQIHTVITGGAGGK